MIGIEERVASGGNVNVDLSKYFEHPETEPSTPPPIRLAVGAVHSIHFILNVTSMVGLRF